MDSKEFVTPVEFGAQEIGKYLKKLDSGFHEMTE